MKLKMLGARVQQAGTHRVKVLETKAGSTERIRGRAWMELRKLVLVRDGYTCCQCGTINLDNEVDHRVPLEQGGSNDPSNLQTLCIVCHGRKTATEARARLGAG